MDYQHGRPERLKTVGRRLRGKKFPKLRAQLENDEEIFAMVQKRRKIHAFWIDSKFAFWDLEEALTKPGIRLIGFCAAPQSELSWVSQVRRQK